MPIDNNISRNDWNIETLRQFFVVSLNEFKVRYDEGRREGDLRYQQRFDASEKALAAQATVAREAVNAALTAAEKSVTAAMAAAEKAIDKAELAQRAHNIGENEWRTTVTEATRLVAENARHESESLVKALSDKLDISIQALTEKVTANNVRINKSDGRSVGVSASISTMIAAAAVLVALLGILITLLNTRAPANSVQYRPPTTTESKAP
jgi:hypothetical protein